MSESLFDLEEQISPRLRWLRMHEVKQQRVDAAFDLPFWCWTGPWQAGDFSPDGAPTAAFFAQADSEDEALVAHAKARGIRLWNEEVAA